jgi:bloom syndrome protein
MKSPRVIQATFNRPEIFYEVRPKLDHAVFENDLIQLIQSMGEEGSGIIYCHKKENCESVAAMLKKKGINAIPYHAGISNNERKKALEDWSSNRVRVVCATIAFGMGIDKADVRFVIHESMPKSLEGFYQESGRAGRDGKNSRSVLYYSREEASFLAFLSRQSKEDPAQQAAAVNSIATMEVCDRFTQF